MIKNDKKAIIKEIWQKYKQCNSMIDAVNEICNKFSIDCEDISGYIRYSKDIKNKIAEEAHKLRMLKPD